MTHPSDRPEPGTCTVIVARVGPRDAESDRALIRATEDALSLPADPNRDNQALSRPELRLVEGVSRATADRVAGAAIRAGFRPRVREELGIKYSNQRGGSTLALGLLAVLTPILMYLLLFAASAGILILDTDAVFLAALPQMALPPLMALWLVSLFGMLARQRSQLYLPLLRSPAQVFGPWDATSALNEPTSEPVAEARMAVRALRSSLEAGLPDIARADLAASVDALDEQITWLANAEHALRGEPASGLEALRRRRDVLRAREDADPEELAGLEEAIRDEADAEDHRERRQLEVVRELLAIRRAATRARLSLTDPQVPDAVARLNQEVEALKTGRAEADPRRAAALRAKQSQR